MNKLVVLAAVIVIMAVVGTATLKLTESTPGPGLAQGGKVIELYRPACGNCQRMVPIVKSVEDRLNFDIDKIDLDTNDGLTIYQRYKTVIRRDCGSPAYLPLFIAEKTKKAKCGVITADDLSAFIEANT